MIKDGVIKPIKEFEQYYKFAKCGCEKKNCKNCHDGNEACLAFCGGCDLEKCKYPCKHCVVWEGYGGIEVIRTLRSKLRKTKLEVE